jgi:uncharacterized membrane protein
MGELSLPRSPIRGKDVSEIVMGSMILAAPLAVTEEVWNLGVELSLGRIAVIAVTSFVVIGSFIYTSFKHDGVIPNGRDFYVRVNTTYFVTLLTCAVMLAGIDRLELFVDPVLALKRTVFIAFPASFAATVVDSIG